MLENIKAIMFIRNTFSILTEKRILLIIKYNKSWQSKLRKSLINYKLFSGKYTKNETINNAKVYNAYDDKLLFEGEYLKGKRNGKGKEYDYDGKLLFEGEYLNGKRNGKGKEYNNYGDLTFEGEYLNGQMNGKGKEYDYNGKLMFEEEYLNGKRKKGLGKESDLLIFSEIIFEGEYLNGEIWNGKGKNFFKNSQLKTYFEYLNGKLWNMKQYDINNNIINEIINGKGSIKLYHYNGNLRIEEYLWRKKWKM